MNCIELTIFPFFFEVPELAPVYHNTTRTLHNLDALDSRLMLLNIITNILLE